MDFFAEGVDAVSADDESTPRDTEILDTDSEVVAMIKELQAQFNIDSHPPNISWQFVYYYYYFIFQKKNGCFRPYFLTALILGS